MPSIEQPHEGSEDDLDDALPAESKINYRPRDDRARSDVISLDSAKWRDELRDAYGPATDIPDILSRLADGSASIMELYDAFALIGRGTATSGAIAAVPHVWAIAAPLPAEERADLLTFIGRVAYGTDHYLEDDELPAFKSASAAARDDLAEAEGSVAHDLILAILAFEWCPITYDAVEGLENESLEVRCPADPCGVEIEVSDWTAIVDEDETTIAPKALPAFDAAAPWLDSNAISRVCQLLNDAGQTELGSKLTVIGGTVECPNCNEHFDLLDELLDPTDF